MASMQSSGLDERMDTLELQIQQLRKLLVQQNGKQGDTQESQIEQLRNLLVEQNEKQGTVILYFLF